jgi:hypothetical protein
MKSSPNAQMTKNQRMRLQSVRVEGSRIKKEPLLEREKLNKILFQPFCLNVRYSLGVVIFGHFVRDDLPARNTPVDDHPALPSAVLHSDGLHHPSAH